MMLSDLKNKKIVLGVTGCIAAYKAAELVRLLKKRGASVRVIMTKSAKEFISPLTFQTLSENIVYDKLFDQHVEMKIGHISLARWADCVLIAPATANIVAKLSNGLTDDLLSTVCLATTAPICIAPAMNQTMWLNAITQSNIKKLKQHGMKIFEPATGIQACGEIGVGRLLEPQEIVHHLQAVFVPKTLTGKRVIITAGSTIEPIDPVRYLSNHSSGKMGYAIAEAAINLGANVTLIAGNTSLPVPIGLNCYIKVNTACEMYREVMNNIKDSHVFISVAAVSDYRVSETAQQKIKKDQNTLTLNLARNPDILADVSAKSPRPFTVGFAAETEDLEKHAREKLRGKQVNMIVTNIVGNGLGFNSDKNRLTVFTKSGEKIKLSEKPKTELAYELMEIINRISEKNAAKELSINKLHD